MTREFLVTKFACSDCRSVLEIEYAGHGTVPYAQNEPTGASMVEHLVLVTPCKCTLAAQEALDSIRKALK
jgi:hypothetical protein